MRVFNLWVMVQPATDLPDQWIAHCLDLDVVTQGTSFEHAMKMAFEAVSLVVTEDIVAGRDPLSRRAPDEFWNELYATVKEGHAVKFSGLKRVDRKAVQSIAGQIVLKVELQPIDQGCGIRPTYDIPLAWERQGSSYEAHCH